MRLKLVEYLTAELCEVLFIERRDAFGSVGRGARRYVRVGEVRVRLARERDGGEHELPVCHGHVREGQHGLDYVEDFAARDFVAVAERPRELEEYGRPGHETGLPLARRREEPLCGLGLRSVVPREESYEDVRVYENAHRSSPMTCAASASAKLSSGARPLRKPR